MTHALDCVLAMAVNGLLLQRPDVALDHAILLGTMGRDETLFSQWLASRVV